MSWYDKFLTEEGDWKLDKEVGEELLEKLKVASPSIYDELIIEKCKRLNAVSRKHEKIKEVEAHYPGSSAPSINSVSKVVNDEIQNIDDSQINDDALNPMKKDSAFSKKENRGQIAIKESCGRADGESEKAKPVADNCKIKLRKFDRFHDLPVSDSAYDENCETVARLKPVDNGYDENKPALKPIDNISKPKRRGGQWGGFACTDDSVKQLNSGINMVNSEVKKFKHITSDYDHGSTVSDSEYEALREKIGEESTKIINGKTSENKKLVHKLINSERKAAHEFIENLGESKEECIEAAKQRDEKMVLEGGDNLAKTQAIVHASYENYYDNCNKNEERNKEIAEQCIIDAGDWKNSSLVLKFIEDTVAEHANIVLDVLSEYSGILNYANALDLIQEKAEDIINDLPEEKQKIINDVCCASRGFAIRAVGYCIDKGEAFLHRGLLTSKSGYFRLARIFCELVASKMCENFFGTSLKRK